MRNATLNDVFHDSALFRALGLQSGVDPTPKQRSVVARLLLDRYQVRVTDDAHLDAIISGFNRRAGPVPQDKLVAMPLSAFSDEMRASMLSIEQLEATEIVAQQNEIKDMGEALHFIERKLISAARSGVQAVSAIIENDPQGLRAAKRMLEEVRVQLTSNSWLKRVYAEVAEEVLKRAINLTKKGEAARVMRMDDEDDESESEGGDDVTARLTAALKNVGREDLLKYVR